MYALYREAATGCPGLSWSVLAGIGKVESDHGRAPRRSARPGRWGRCRCCRRRSTRTRSRPPGGAAPPTPWDPVDAVYRGRADAVPERRRGQAGTLPARYSPTTTTGPTSIGYLSWPTSMRPRSPPDGLLVEAARQAPSHSARIAIDYAAAQVGLPYVWGGDGPKLTRLQSGKVQVTGGFDCSGLVQAAYAMAGVGLPRTATAQYRQGGKVVTPGQPLEAGDLVFYGDAAFLHHVGIAVSATMMIDAPHTGAVVRLDPIRYQGDDYFGAVRPIAAASAGAP